MPDFSNAVAALIGHHCFRSNEFYTPASRFYVAFALHAFGIVAWRLPYLPEACFFEVTINIANIPINCACRGSSISSSPWPKNSLTHLRTGLLSLVPKSATMAERNPNHANLQFQSAPECLQSWAGGVDLCSAQIAGEGFSSSTLANRSCQACRIRGLEDFNIRGSEAHKGPQLDP